jgi:hypothetical protein
MEGNRATGNQTEVLKIKRLSIKQLVLSLPSLLNRVFSWQVELVLQVEEGLSVEGQFLLLLLDEEAERTTRITELLALSLEHVSGHAEVDSHEPELASHIEALGLRALRPRFLE